MLKVAPLTLAVTVLPVMAFAHSGGYFGFVAGLSHPLGGADHVLAMVAVGLWAALTGGRAIWAMPLAFLSAMAAGGGMGVAGWPFPAVEPMILASIVILGLAAALALRVPLTVAVTGIAVFGLAHGHAHGAEVEGGDFLAFGAGFVLSSAALHLAGLTAGLVMGRLGQSRATRGLGLGVAAAGLALGIGA